MIQSLQALRIDRYTNNWLKGFVLGCVILGPTIAMLAGSMSSDDDSYRAAFAVNTFDTFSDARFLAILAYAVSNTRLIRRGNNAVQHSSPLAIWRSNAALLAFILFAGEFVYQLTSLGIGIRERVFDVVTLMELALNAISYSALMTTVGCMPAALGASIYLTLAAVISICTATTMSNANATPAYLKEIAAWICCWIGDFVYPTIDLLSVVASATPNISLLVVYISNIVVYLLLAQIISRKRGLRC